MRNDGFIKSAARRLAADRRGNFGILATILVPVLLASVAISMDISKLLSDKTKLSSALDASSLATASALTNGDITTAQAQNFAARIAGGQLAATLTASQITELKASLVANVTSQGSGSKKDYTVKVTGQFSEKLLAFSTFHAGGTRTIAGSSTSSSQAQTATAISLYLVVDESGSMAWPTDTVDSTKTGGCYQYPQKDWDKKIFYSPCYVSKIASLKTAASGLFDQLDSIEAVDASNSLVRVAVNSFNHQLEGHSDLAWGTSAARSYVSGLPTKPTGGTDMTGALDEANKALNSAGEVSAQAAKGNKTFKKFMVLMTDGENTGYSSDWDPDLDAAALKTCAAARAAGVVVFTVAYMAPPNGETMLRSCAGDTSNYYKASDVKSLNKAFADIGGKVANQTTRMTN